MPELKSADGRYLAADQGDGNFVVYRTADMVPLWDRWSYEAAQPIASQPVVVPTTPTIPGALQVLRVTTEADGEFVNRQYSYWPTAFVDGEYVYVFAGHVDEHPRFYLVHLPTGVVKPIKGIPYAGTSEGWYWDAEGQIFLCDHAELRRIDPFSGVDRLVFSIADTHPGCILWQAHSSDDGQVHCATVKQVVPDGAYPALGTVVFRNGREEYFPAQGELDESQITPDGEFLIIHESNDNRIINLETRETRWLRNGDGAVEHSDCGPGYIVGEDDQHGACVKWDLRQPLTPERRLELFKTWGMGHVSVRGDRCLLSGAIWLSLVALDGTGTMPLVAHGMVSDETYDTQVKANLDPTGRVASYMSNQAGRMDLYLLVLG